MEKESARKLKEFRKQNRKSQISSIMIKLRDEALTQLQKQENQQLNSIINLSVSDLNSQHLKAVIDYVNRDKNNAILFLGNLVIDRAISPEHLDGIEWKIGNNEHWGWLINVFNEVGYMTEQMMEYMLNRIIHKKSQQNLLNILESLLRCLGNDENYTISKIVSNQKAICALLNHVQDPNQKIFINTLKFLVSLMNNEQVPRIIERMVGGYRMQKAFSHASMKLSKYGRVLAIQAVNNCLMSGVFLLNTINRFLQNALNEHQKAKIQLSYLFIAMSRNLPTEHLQKFLNTQDLINILQTYNQLGYNMKQGDEVVKNTQQAMHIIGERLFKRPFMNQNALNSDRMYEICRGGQAMRDESEEVTEYHQLF